MHPNPGHIWPHDEEGDAACDRIRPFPTIIGNPVSDYRADVFVPYAWIESFVVPVDITGVDVVEGDNITFRIAPFGETGVTVTDWDMRPQHFQLVVNGVTSEDQTLDPSDLIGGAIEYRNLHLQGTGYYVAHEPMEDLATDGFTAKDGVATVARYWNDENVPAMLDEWPANMRTTEQLVWRGPVEPSLSPQLPDGLVALRAIADEVLRRYDKRDDPRKHYHVTVEVPDTVAATAQNLHPRRLVSLPLGPPAIDNGPPTPENYRIKRAIFTFAGRFTVDLVLEQD